MDPTKIFNASILVLSSISATTVVGLVLHHRRTSRIIEILDPVRSNQKSAPLVREMMTNARDRSALEGINAVAQYHISTTPKQTLNDQLFHAGIFAEADRTRFLLWRRLVFVLATGLGVFLGSFVSPSFMLIGAGLGMLVGLQIPRSFLQRSIEQRGEEIMFYLPLVIEQLVIGVSSSLDIGPCIRWIVSMADERDSHNPVTELLRYAQQYTKSGVSLEEALLEVGNLAGHTELNHVFMSLSQVTKHGGEITRQLQELANAVAAQREARIEGKIRKLELAATGPVTLVFVSFMAIFMAGLGSQFGAILK